MVSKYSMPVKTLVKLVVLIVLLVVLMVVLSVTLIQWLGLIQVAERKAKLGYFGTKLSENMIQTPEGYLVCKNAVLARTGFQEYKGEDLLETEAEDLIEGGLNPNAIYKVYRPEDEVFKQTTLDSFNGKIFTLTHPDELLNINTVSDHDRGHVLNIRRGDELLEDGNLGMLGDIMVTDKEAVTEILNGLRELSCGYNYHIALRGGNLVQVEIVGNHVALVKNARAGKVASIKDAALPYEGVRRWFANSSIETIAAIF